jgi:hypothetical protein
MSFDSHKIQLAFAVDTVAASDCTYVLWYRTSWKLETMMYVGSSSSRRTWRKSETKKKRYAHQLYKQCDVRLVGETRTLLKWNSWALTHHSPFQVVSPGTDASRHNNIVPLVLTTPCSRVLLEKLIVTQSNSPAPILSQVHPIHTFRPFPPRMNTNIFPITLRSSEWSVPVRFSD